MIPVEMGHIGIRRRRRGGRQLGRLGGSQDVAPGLFEPHHHVRSPVQPVFQRPLHDQLAIDQLVKQGAAVGLRSRLRRLRQRKVELVDRDLVAVDPRQHLPVIDVGLASRQQDRAGHYQAAPGQHQASAAPSAGRAARRRFQTAAASMSRPANIKA